jgi:predicted alpha/beta hydrolase family esterase
MTSPIISPTTTDEQSVDLSNQYFSQGGRETPPGQDIASNGAAPEGESLAKSSLPSIDIVDFKNCGYQLIIQPGWQDSGPRHWQSLWAKKYDLPRIQQRDWERPTCQDWVDTIVEAAAKHPAPVIVAHSLGCIAVVHAIQRGLLNPAAVILVAPADMDNNIHDVTATGFSPIPTDSLRCPCLVIASDNDKYMTGDRSRVLAEHWGADFVLLENHGHINADSGIDEWRGGQAMVLEFLRRIQQH